MIWEQNELFPIKVLKCDEDKKEERLRVIIGKDDDDVEEKNEE